MGFKKILFVPCADDLDQPGARALLALAGPDTEVEVFEPVYSTDLEDYPVADEETEKQIREGIVQERLERIKGLGEALEGRGLKSTTTAAWDHPLHEAIIRRALKTQADLVITEPIEGRSGALSHGDWRLVSRCPVPLLLVRRERVGDFEKIVAAVDPFHEHRKPAELDREIIQTARTVQGLTHGELRVVNCFAPLASVVAAPYTEHLPIDDAEESLEVFREGVLEKLVVEAGLPSTAATLIKGRPNDALKALVEDGSADLLVMGGLSRGRISDFVLGNTAEHMLYHTDVDVLIVKPGGFHTTVAEKMPEDTFSGPLYFPPF